MQRVLVTGAAGFVGTAVLQALGRAGYTLRATWHRRPPPPGLEGVDWRQDDLTVNRDRASDLLRDVDIVVHAAGRVHVNGPLRCWPAPFLAANALATGELASQARRAGVRRFLFLSTVGVHGLESPMEGAVPRPLRATDPFRPASAYARSKLAGESALAETCADGVMAPVILRPPLVFGPGNGGNFLRLLRWLDRGLPLPTVARTAARSLMYVENLARLITECVRHPDVAGRTFLVADFDAAVLALAEKLAALLGRPLHAWPLPGWIPAWGPLRAVTKPLIVDAGPIRTATGCHPAVGVDDALARTVAWYRRSARP
jgi:nucleoside-diphosphate-sugar epimerase